MDFIYPTNISMDQDMLHTNFVSEIILSWNPQPEWYRCNTSWESIDVPEGYEKPPKEEFEAKLQELIDAQPLKELRAERDMRLAQTDRYATLDYPHSNLVVQQTWFNYRQALRDLPTATEDPANPVWPTAPTS
tara:strand:- start:174 stop:572 length:399 start_codon:yes stop_codon:yes gene_type:complete